MQKHFNVGWPLIAENLSKGESNGIYSYLGSSTESRPTDGNQYEYTGLLFEYGDYEQIFEWCQVQSLPILRQFANHLPIMDQNQPGSWHPFTLGFIDKFGKDASLLQEIEARMNTWGAVGSVEGMYQFHLELFKKLVNHPIDKVKVWALKKTDQLPLVIGSERDYVEEFYINR